VTLLKFRKPPTVIQKSNATHSDIHLTSGYSLPIMSLLGLTMLVTLQVTYAGVRRPGYKAGLDVYMCVQWAP